MKYFILVFLLFFTLNASNLSNAFVNYKTYFEDKSSGTYEKESVLFFIAEVPITNKKLKKIHYEGKCMLLVKDLIKEYLKKSIDIDTKELPYKGKLGEDLNEFIENDSYINLNLSNLEARVLVNRVNGVNRDIYRYVVAISKDKLEAQRDSLTANTKDFKFYLTDFFENAKKEDKLYELMLYYLELGLIEDSLLYQKKILSKELNLINFYTPKNPYLERQILREILISQELNNSLLNRLPANREILFKLIDEHKENPLAKIVLLFTSLVNSDNKSAIKENLTLLSESYKNMQEYTKLIDSLKIESEFFEKNTLLTLTLKTLGHLEIDKSLSNSSNEYFENAKSLFSKGIKPNEIIALLSKSIESSPNHFESWDYLGAVLLSQDRVKEALIIYNQAYQINSDNIEVMAHIADCYHRLGFKSLAGSYANYLSILNRDLQNQFVIKVINKINKG